MSSRPTVDELKERVAASERRRREQAERIAPVIEEARNLLIEDARLFVVMAIAPLSPRLAAAMEGWVDALQDLEPPDVPALPDEPDQECPDCGARDVGVLTEDGIAIPECRYCGRIAYLGPNVRYQCEEPEPDELDQAITDLHAFLLERRPFPSEQWAVLLRHLGRRLGDGAGPEGPDEAGAS